MEDEIEKLKKRIEELEKRPQLVPYYPPIQQFPPYPVQPINQSCWCGRAYPHVCVWC